MHYSIHDLSAPWIHFDFGQFISHARIGFEKNRLSLAGGGEEPAVKPSPAPLAVPAIRILGANFRLRDDANLLTSQPDSRETVPGPTPGTAACPSYRLHL